MRLTQGARVGCAWGCAAVGIPAGLRQVGAHTVGSTTLTVNGLDQSAETVGDLCNAANVQDNAGS